METDTDPHVTRSFHIATLVAAGVLLAVPAALLPRGGEGRDVAAAGGRHCSRRRGARAHGAVPEQPRDHPRPRGRPALGRRCPRGARGPMPSHDVRGRPRPRPQFDEHGRRLSAAEDPARERGGATATLVFGALALLGCAALVAGVPWWGMGATVAFGVVAAAAVRAHVGTYLLIRAAGARQAADAAIAYDAAGLGGRRFAASPGHGGPWLDSRGR